MVYCWNISIQTFYPCTNAICHSVNVDNVVVLHAGGGDTSTLHVVIEVFAFR